MFGWDKETKTQWDWINGAKVNMVSNYLICLVSFGNMNKEAAESIYMYLTVSCFLNSPEQPCGQDGVVVS
jgi:hypothetical protein